MLEARLDKGRGPVATVLVQDGTLRVGDTVVAGAVSGKVRALVDDRGERLKTAGPSTPVEILGLTSLPEPGDQLLVVTDPLKAQSIVNFRQLKLREKAMAASSRIRLEDLGRAIAEGQLKELPLVLKADVQGSVEAVTDQLKKLPQDKIKLRIIRSGVGAITEGDVLLAAASERGRDRLQRAARAQGGRDRRARQGRDPPLHRHLRRGRRDEEGHGGPPRAHPARGAPGRRRGARHLQDLQDRHDRRLPRAGRQGQPQRRRCGCCATTWSSTPAR